MKLTRRQLKTIILESILNEMPMIKPKDPIDWVKDPEYKRKIDVLKKDPETKNLAYSLATSIQPNLEDILTPKEQEEMEADLPPGAQLEEPGYRGDDYLEDEKSYDRLALMPYFNAQYFSKRSVDKLKSVANSPIYIYGLAPPVPGKSPMKPNVKVMDEKYFPEGISKTLTLGLQTYATKFGHAYKYDSIIAARTIQRAALELYYEDPHISQYNLGGYTSRNQTLDQALASIDDFDKLNKIIIDILIGLIKMSSHAYMDYLSIDELGIGNLEALNQFFDNYQDIDYQKINDRIEEYYTITNSEIGQLISNKKLKIILPHENYSYH